MALLNLLASVRTPILTSLALITTQLGEETFLLVIGLILFWCIDTKKGYKLLAVSITGLALNSLLKVIFAVPRPWVLQPGIAVESAIGAATGFSFPSGHTQTAVMVFFVLAYYIRKDWCWILAGILSAAVAVSRMYLGVHMPMDVLIGTVLGAASVIIVLFLMKNDSVKEQLRIVLIAIGIAVITLLYSYLAPQKSIDQDAASYLSGIKDDWVELGVLIAMGAYALLSGKKTAFQTQATLPAQILKLVIGFPIVMGIRLGLKAILPSAGWTDGLRYGIMALFALMIWPKFFTLLEKLCSRKH